MKNGVSPLRLVRGGAGRGLERLFARFLRVALMAAWCPRLFLLLFSLSYVPGQRYLIAHFDVRVFNPPAIFLSTTGHVFFSRVPAPRALPRGGQRPSVLGHGRTVTSLGPALALSPASPLFVRPCAVQIGSFTRLSRRLLGRPRPMSPGGSRLALCPQLCSLPSRAFSPLRSLLCEL